MMARPIDLSFMQQMPGDHEALYFRSSLIEGENASVSV
jgi:hypothetical protein